MSEKLWNDVANNINKAGKIPVPVTDTVLEILKTVMTEEQARYLLYFDKFNKSMNMDELIERTGKDREYNEKMLKSLMYEGVVAGFPSRSTGMIIYYLIPLLPGFFEFTLMRGETTPKAKKLAKLFDTLFTELANLVQSNYDLLVPAFQSLPPTDRIIPVESEINADRDEILPAEEVEKIIDKFDIISVAVCYCRHEKDLMNDPCKTTKVRENCIMLGPAARFTIDNKFARQITKEEAKRILRQSEDEGLVHKSFHTRMDPEKDQDSICSCCKCCCGTFQLYYRGARAMQSYTSYLAEINKDDCSGCGACVDICPMEAVTLVDEIAVIEKDKCLGCGLCAHHCDFDAAKLVRTGMRAVFVAPPRVGVK